MKAIETHYAGCRFRSRLEARWAVFFDTLHIEWQYEPEGFELEHRLSQEDGIIRYLPDFHLPLSDIYVEVKGSLTDAELLRLLDIAAAFNGRGGCSTQPPFMICGHVPRPGSGLHPFVTHMHKGGLQADSISDRHVTAAMFRPHSGFCSGSNSLEIAADYGGNLDTITSGCPLTVEQLKYGILHGPRDPDGPHQSNLETAYKAASMARFEHGEQPAIPYVDPDWHRLGRPADAARAQLAAIRGGNAR